MRWHRTLIALALASAPLSAQTTGVPGRNDFTINGLFSGSQSCRFLVLPAFAPLSFEIDTAPSNAAVIFVSPTCSPNLLAGCSGTTLDLGLPLIFFHGGLADANGEMTAPPVTVGISGALFAAQGVILDAGCPGELLYTQAYSVVLK